MDEARRLVAHAPAGAVVERATAKLCAPIQPPPQMRDCSCFELHLKQSFAAARRARVAHLPNPEEALAQMNTRADERVIATFNRQPIYYKCNPLRRDRAGRGRDLAFVQQGDGFSNSNSPVISDARAKISPATGHAITSSATPSSMT
jgi:hypothetical protein